MKEIYLKVVEENFGIVKEIQSIGNCGKKYKVDLEDSIIKVDILYPGDDTIRCHKICLDKGYKFLPKIKKVIEVGNKRVKVSDWVIGDTYLELCRLNSLTVKMLFEMGKSTALLNNVEEQGQHLHIPDLVYQNVVWDTNGCFMMIDFGALCFRRGIFDNLCRLLLREVKKRNLIDAFVKGYKKHRDVRRLVNLCEEKNWEYVVSRR